METTPDLTAGNTQQRIKSAPAGRAGGQQQHHAGQEVPAQVRCFAAHYAGDEGLARPFSAAPSDRNLAWGEPPAGLEQPHGPAHRYRHEVRHSPIRNAGAMLPQDVCMLKHILLLSWLQDVPAYISAHSNAYTCSCCSCVRMEVCLEVIVVLWNVSVQPALVLHEVLNHSTAVSLQATDMCELLKAVEMQIQLLRRV